MNFILEKRDFYKVDDIVLIEYWYNGMICEVKIKEHIGNKYKVSYNVKNSEIFNAPDQVIKYSEIIDISRSNK